MRSEVAAGADGTLSAGRPGDMAGPDKVIFPRLGGPDLGEPRGGLGVHWSILKI